MIGLFGKGREKGVLAGWAVRFSGVGALFLALSMQAQAMDALPRHANLPAQAGRTTASVPDFVKVLSDKDRATYTRIFLVQESGNWAEADRLLKKIDNPILKGHVLFQRYMHPTAYRSSYAELAEWLKHYADHPQADRIHGLAVRRRPGSAPRPQRPLRKSWRVAKRQPSAFQVHNPRRSPAQRRTVQKIEQQVRALLRRERPTQALNLISGSDTRKKLTTVEFDRMRVWVAESYFAEQVDNKALKLAYEVASRNRQAVPLADWTAGLAAWRLGKPGKAAEHFQALAKAEHLGDWERSAGAYWAARTLLRVKAPGDVVPMLRIAGEVPLSFYGLLARRQLGLSPTDPWATLDLTAADFQKLSRDKGVLRAAALTQVGRIPDADLELSWAHGRLELADDPALVALARHLNLAHAQLKVALYSGAEGLESGLFPIPAYVPEGGYTVDRALLFAIMRKESKFVIDAKSRAGARGLMQVMPATARYISGDASYLGAGRERLMNPSHNLSLAQNYTTRLMDLVEPKSNLLMVVAAYNAGPGNVRRWRSRVKYGNDPLLFVETIPLTETRNYVEKVMASFWIYRASLGQPVPSLDALAAGDWPFYEALDPPAGRARVALRGTAPLDVGP